MSNISYDVIIFQNDVLKDKSKKFFIERTDASKVCVFSKKNKNDNYETYLELPTTLKDINAIVSNSIAKKTFNKNSSIKIKNYLLDKNEKKLIKNKNFLILTEKEIQLLELLLKAKHPITKNNILSSVWHYAKDVDTHTVETHIYRLRKKIIDKFVDEKFILNNKDGYFL